MSNSLYINTEYFFEYFEGRLLSEYSSNFIDIHHLFSQIFDIFNDLQININQQDLNEIDDNKIETYLDEIINFIDQISKDVPICLDLIYLQDFISTIKEKTDYINNKIWKNEFLTDIKDEEILTFLRNIYISIDQLNVYYIPMLENLINISYNLLNHISSLKLQVLSPLNQLIINIKAISEGCSERDVLIAAKKYEETEKEKYLLLNEPTFLKFAEYEKQFNLLFTPIGEKLKPFREIATLIDTHNAELTPQVDIDENDLSRVFTFLSLLASNSIKDLLMKRFRRTNEFKILISVLPHLGGLVLSGSFRLNNVKKFPNRLLQEIREVDLDLLIALHQDLSLVSVELQKIRNSDKFRQIVSRLYQIDKIMASTIYEYEDAKELHKKNIRKYKSYIDKLNKHQKKVKEITLKEFNESITFNYDDIVDDISNKKK